MYSQIDLQDGTGPMANSGQTATVNYTGWLYSEDAPEHKGAKFDSSVGRGPFSFKIGAGRVIRGWDQGVQGMKVGGVRRLVLPPEFAYGAAGAGGVIPAERNPGLRCGTTWRGLNSPTCRTRQNAITTVMPLRPRETWGARVILAAPGA